jgi:hypothetical protein
MPDRLRAGGIRGRLSLLDRVVSIRRSRQESMRRKVVRNERIAELQRAATGRAAPRRSTFDARGRGR